MSSAAAHATTLVFGHDPVPACRRILAVLRKDPTLAAEIKQFRFGSRPREQDASVLPLLYVTPADRPEVSAQPFGPRPSASVRAPRLLAVECWVRILAGGPTPESVQERIYALAARAHAVLARNVRLSLPNPFCASSDLHMQGSLMRWRGTLLEGQTLRVIMHGVVGYGAASAEDAEEEEGDDGPSGG